MLAGFAGVLIVGILYGLAPFALSLMNEAYVFDGFLMAVLLLAEIAVCFYLPLLASRLMTQCRVKTALILGSGLVLMVVLNILYIPEFGPVACALTRLGVFAAMAYGLLRFGRPALNFKSVAPVLRGARGHKGL